MKSILILSLVLMGLVEIPLFNDLKTKEIMVGGEVKGEEITIQRLSEPTVQNNASSFISPSPCLSSTPTSIIQSTDTPKTFPLITEEMILLDQEKKLKDEKLEFFFPELDQSKTWYLRVVFELNSVEDVLGFDSPGFTIHVDDRLAYQRSVFETGVETISFNLAAFSNTPQTLSIWSGNTGDEFKDTFAIIKKIKLISKNTHHFIETEVINDLLVTVDSDEYFTLEWSSPKTNDVNLEKPLAYEIRYLSEQITSENWSQAQLAEVFLPQNFSPQAAGSKEIVLVKKPAIARGYLVIRSIDSAGILSPLGESVLFKVKD